MTSETELSISIIDMSKEELQTQYTALSKLYSQLQLELEKKCQQIYDDKREISRLSALEAEYLNEIESIRTEERKECEELKLKIQNLEEEKTDITNVYSEQIECIHLEMFRKDEEIVKLQEELKGLLNICDSNNDKTEIDKLYLMNSELKNEGCKLHVEIDVLKEEIESFQKQYLIQQEQNKNLQDELTTLNENYKCKKNELDEAKDLIETIQEDLMLTKTKLETISNKPLQDGSQGNSLFVEVDDRRVELQDRMAIMKSQYLEIRQERAKLLSEIAMVHSRNATLCQRWETEAQDKIDDDDRLEEACRARMNALESQLETCLAELSFRQKIAANNLESGEIEFMENMLELKNKEIVKVMEQVKSFSLSRMILSQQLRDSNIEMRNWRAKAASFESKLGRLQIEIEELKIKKTTENKDNSPKASYCPDCIRNKKFSIQVPLMRPKLRDVADAFCSTSNIISEHPLNTVDYSRQIKRSHLKQADLPLQETQDTETISEIKENVNNTNKLETCGNVTKTVQFTEEVVNNSANNRGNLRKGGKVIYCKPVVLKKRY